MTTASTTTTSSSGPLATRLRRLRRAVLARRRLLAAVFAAAALATAVQAVRPAPAPTAPLAVAAADLPAGHVLTEADIARVDAAPALHPSGALDPDRPPLGRPLAAPVRAGQPLTDLSVVGPGLLDAHPVGTVLTTVRVVDPAAVALVRVGDAVSVVGAPLLTGAGRDPVATVLATEVPVVALPEAESAGSGGAGTGTPIVLAVDESTAAALAAAEVTHRLSVWVMPGTPG